MTDKSKNVPASRPWFKQDNKLAASKWAVPVPPPKTQDTITRVPSAFIQPTGGSNLSVKTKFPTAGGSSLSVATHIPAAPSRASEFSDSDFTMADLATPGTDITMGDIISAVSKMSTESEAPTMIQDHDGDIVMQDMDNIEVVTEVAHIIQRERNAPEFNQETTTQVTPSGGRIRDPFWLFVVDTNFLLSHLQLLDELLKAYTEWHHVIVIPWAVFQELDHLKKSEKGVQPEDVNGNSALRNSKWARKGTIGRLARLAIDWINNGLAQRIPSLWGQRKEETNEKNVYRGDEAILDCCRYFIEKEKHRTALMSNDRNLCNMALLYEIRTISYRGATLTANTILTVVMNDIASPAASFAGTVIGKASLPARKHMEPKPAVVQASFSNPVDGKPSPGLAASSKITLPANVIKDAGPSSQVYTGSARITSYSSSSEVASKATSLKSGLGLHASIHAHDGNFGSPKPQPTYHYIPLNARPTQVPGPSPFFSGSQNSGNNSHTANVGNVKAGLKELLEKIEREILLNIPPLLHQCTLKRLGDQCTLRWLHVKKPEEMKGLSDIEKFIEEHWFATMSEVLPRGMDAIYSNNRLSEAWQSWYGWATSSYSPRPTKPAAKDLMGWIEEWDLLWKRILIDNNDSDINIQTVSRWRALAAQLGLA